MSDVGAEGSAVPLRYAVHGYAWTPSWSSDDLWIVEHVKELGLDALEVPLMEPEKVDAAAVRERAEACGLELMSSLALPAGADPAHEDPKYRRRGLEMLVRCIELTAEMGGTLLCGVVYAAIGRLIDRRPEKDDYLRAAEVLKDAAQYARTCGVTIGVEAINRYETFLVNTAGQALELCALVDEPNVGVHLDAYHMNIEEDDFYTATLTAVPRLVHFHLSESNRGIPGRGTVDWDAIMRALADGGYSGHVGLESFVGISEAMRAATCIWRSLAPDSDTLVREGIAYLKGREEAHFSAVAETATH
jgi:D-psicose/D-tagatose/L-ribulose 3-epimerase